MPIVVTAEQEFIVGSPIVVEAFAPEGNYAAVFEDDEATGYFYALDTSRKGNSIENAVHIYNVSNVTDRDIPSVVKIGWSVDSTKVVLLINGYAHAVFNFSEKRGYCRTGFPPPASDSAWAAHGFGHDWTDEAIDLFA